MGETLRQLYKLLFAFFGLAKQGTWLVAIELCQLPGKELGMDKEEHVPQLKTLGMKFYFL